jgi:hypothetical protein
MFALAPPKNSYCEYKKGDPRRICIPLDFQIPPHPGYLHIGLSDASERPARPYI